MSTEHMEELNDQQIVRREKMNFYIVTLFSNRLF